MALDVDRPLQRLHHLAEVLAHGGLGRVGVARGAGFHDRLVLVERALRAAGPEEGPELKAGTLRLQAGEEPAGGRVIGNRPEALAKLAVALRVAEPVLVA